VEATTQFNVIGARWLVFPGSATSVAERQDDFALFPRDHDDGFLGNLGNELAGEASLRVLGNVCPLAERLADVRELERDRGAILCRLYLEVQVISGGQSGASYAAQQRPAQDSIARLYGDRGVVKVGIAGVSPVFMTEQYEVSPTRPRTARRSSRVIPYLNHYSRSGGKYGFTSISVARDVEVDCVLQRFIAVRGAAIASITICAPTLRNVPSAFQRHEEILRKRLYADSHGCDENKEWADTTQHGLSLC
jgi:hypothetical protein